MPPQKVRELVIDAHGCRADLSAAGPLEAAMRDAVSSVGAHVVGHVSCLFQPHGLTICLVLKESHLILSTWPEYDLAIVNVFLCNETMDPKALWARLAKALAPDHCTFQTVTHELTRASRAA